MMDVLDSNKKILNFDDHTRSIPVDDFMKDVWERADFARSPLLPPLNYYIGMKSPPNSTLLKSSGVQIGKHEFRIQVHSIEIHNNLKDFLQNSTSTFELYVYPFNLCNYLVYTVCKLNLLYFKDVIYLIMKCYVDQQKDEKNSKVTKLFSAVKTILETIETTVNEQIQWISFVDTVSSTQLSLQNAIKIILECNVSVNITGIEPSSTSLNLLLYLLFVVKKKLGTLEAAGAINFNCMNNQFLAYKKALANFGIAFSKDSSCITDIENSLDVFAYLENPDRSSTIDIDTSKDLSLTALTLCVTTRKTWEQASKTVKPMSETFWSLTKIVTGGGRPLAARRKRRNVKTKHRKQKKSPSTISRKNVLEKRHG